MALLAYAVVLAGLAAPAGATARRRRPALAALLIHTSAATTNARGTTAVVATRLGAGPRGSARRGMSVGRPAYVWSGEGMGGVGERRLVDDSWDGCGGAHR